MLALTAVVVLSGLTLASLSGLGSANPAAVATPYSVTFSETGLPAGTNWSVHVAYIGCGCDGVHKTVTSNLPTITIAVTNGSYRYQIERVSGYYVNGVAHGTFNVSANNTTADVSVVFEPVIPFLVEFTEVGLPNGTLWTVSVTGNGHGQERALEDQTASSYGTTLNFTLPNATYRYTVANVPGSFFINHTSRGTFVVAGASPPPIVVKFTTPPTFDLTFTETGLPNGTNWSVRVGGWGGVPIRETESSTTANITFAIPNGTYRYVVAEVLGFVVSGPNVGNVTLTNATVTVPVTFRAVAEGAFYPVAFRENGLPNGSHWSVLVIATHTFGHSRTATQSSNSSTLFFLLQNGTYRFQVREVRGYTATGASGTFNITGSAPGQIVVTFTAVPTYTVSFSESGLPAGTSWSVLVRSQTAQSTPWPIHVVQTANTTTITFTEPNGTYCYRIYAVAGYTITSGVAAGSFSIAGAPPTGVSVVFSPKG